MKRHSDLLIKILSLGIGLAVGIVLIAKVFFELSYDSFYKDIDRVYTIRTWISQNGDEKDYGQVSGAVAVGFMEEVPGVETGTRTTFVFNGDTYLDEDGNKLKATLVCADTCFFKVNSRSKESSRISPGTEAWTMTSSFQWKPTASRARTTGSATTGTKAMSN